MFAQLVSSGKQIGSYLGQVSRLMVGVDYPTYLAHMQKTHPEQTPLPYEEFFKQRQAARYGAGGNVRCC